MIYDYITGCFFQLYAMEYRLLGKSSLQISKIGLGCMSLKKGSVADNEAILLQAVEAGINFFDTADLYEQGWNEQLIGKVLQQHRQKLILATKVGNQWRPDGSGWDWNPRKAYILQAVEGSLRRLRTDYIDLYQLHGGTIDDPIEETIEAFELLQQQGKIRYYGISSIRPNVIREYVRRSNMVSVMMQYSLGDRRPEEACFSLLQENNIGVLARGGLAQGLLVNKPAKSYLQYTAAEIQALAAAVKAVSGSGRSATQTALQFALHHPAVTCVVTGVSTGAQLAELVQTTGSPALTDKELADLQRVLPANQYLEHR